MDPELFENCLVKTRFTQDNIINGTIVNNTGTAGDLNMTAKSEFVLKQKTIGRPLEGLMMGSLEAE